MQLYRLKYEKPEIFRKLRWALHLPQYLSYLLTGQAFSDITSVGCHTNLWDFQKNDYHEWVEKEGIAAKLAPIASSDKVIKSVFPGNNYLVGTGLHDSSAALIPYMVNFQEPFVLISSGTWCISLNPYNDSPLTVDELKNDCLCYLHYKGKPVKASRIFAGQEHEDGVKRIADHFNQNTAKYKSVVHDPELIAILQKNGQRHFYQRDLSLFRSDLEAYHQLLLDITWQQVASTQLVLKGSTVKRLFVDGGFSKNAIYMNLLAASFPHLEVFAASMAQATALGAALAIHSSWNKKPLPNTLIKLQYFAQPQDVIL